MSDPIQLPVPPRLGQQTAVEQSRAVEEVRAAIIVAQQCPRDTQVAIAQMQESCKMRQLADRAFYRFPRAGQNITGPSVYLARELARCWGNIQYGVAELARDDEHGQSEMQAFAWDVQTNTRPVQVFIVPHKRDKKDKKTGQSQPEPLIDMRDIYENNANNGARRLRECIFAVLPPWFVEEAKDLCAKTIEGTDAEKPLQLRIADIIAAFATNAGVDEAALTRKIGRPSAKWTAHDLATLRVIGSSLARNETTVEEEFPAVDTRVTAADVIGKPTAAPAAAGPAVPTAEDIAAMNAEADGA
jgi:hypothetical protein